MSLLVTEYHVQGPCIFTRVIREIWLERIYQPIPRPEWNERRLQESRKSIKIRRISTGILRDECRDQENITLSWSQSAEEASVELFCDRSIGRDPERMSYSKYPCNPPEWSTARDDLLGARAWHTRTECMRLDYWGRPCTKCFWDFVSFLGLYTPSRSSHYEDPSWKWIWVNQGSWATFLFQSVSLSQSKMTTLSRSLWTVRNILYLCLDVCYNLLAFKSLWPFTWTVKTEYIMWITLSLHQNALGSW